MHLVADIGATNARFRLCGDQGWGGEAWLTETSRFTSANALLIAAQAALELDDVELEGATLAVAGPWVDGVVTITNTGLVLSEAECCGVFKAPVAIVNDFFALAYGVPHFSALHQLGGGSPSRHTKAILGPGSGLGMASLEPTDHGWVVLSGEGGHADLAPGNHLEAELWSLMMAEFGHVSWETVLSGNGIVNLYRAMCATWGNTPEPLTAAEISHNGQEMTDLVCHQTLETFAGILGAAAGNLALTVGAVGGVYIGGGIAPRMIDFLKTAPLRRRFEEKGKMSEYVAEIPLLIVTEEAPGLIGARAFAFSNS
jgi:glucokinase